MNETLNRSANENFPAKQISQLEKAEAQIVSKSLEAFAEAVDMDSIVNNNEEFKALLDEKGIDVTDVDFSNLADLRGNAARAVVLFMQKTGGFEKDALDGFYGPQTAEMAVVRFDVMHMVREGLGKLQSKVESLLEDPYATTRNFEVPRQTCRTRIQRTLDEAVKQGLPKNRLPELEHRLKKYVIDNPDFSATADVHSFDDRCTQIRLEFFEEEALVSDSEINDDKYGVKLTKKAAPRFLGETEIRQAAIAAGWPAAELDNVVRVCLAECRGNAHNAVRSPNGTYDVGCMQINTVHSVAGELGAGIKFDDLQNDDVACLKLALKIKEKKGWGEWVTVNNGKAKISYPDSETAVS